MKTHPTPITAALAGMFSAACWPWLWPLFKDPSSASTAWLVVGTLLCIALPAHAFVVGFGHRVENAGRTVDVALLRRIAAWLLAAALTAGVVAWQRAAGSAL